MIEPRKISEREQWFIDRIGKTVYRTDTGCCSICERVYKEGLQISDAMHADYLFMCESEFTHEGNLLRYFDTIQERDEFEKLHPEIAERNAKKTTPDPFKK